MSVTNEQITHLRALDANKKQVSATYTVRTGRPSDNFVIDNPIDVLATGDYVITVPSGYKMGQELLLVCTERTGSYDVDISITNHVTSDPEVLHLNLADEYVLLMWTGTEWVTVCGDATV